MPNPFINTKKDLFSQDQVLYNPDGSAMTTVQANDSLRRVSNDTSVRPSFQSQDQNMYNLDGSLMTTTQYNDSLNRRTMSEGMDALHRALKGIFKK